MTKKSSGETFARNNWRKINGITGKKSKK